MLLLKMSCPNSSPTLEIYSHSEKKGQDPSTKRFSKGKRKEKKKEALVLIQTLIQFFGGKRDTLMQYSIGGWFKYYL